MRAGRFPGARMPTACCEWCADGALKAEAEAFLHWVRPTQAVMMWCGSLTWLPFTVILHTRIFSALKLNHLCGIKIFYAIMIKPFVFVDFPYNTLVVQEFYSMVSFLLLGFTVVRRCLKDVTKIRILTVTEPVAVLKLNSRLQMELNWNLTSNPALP